MIWISGHSQSGTTLLLSLLDGHPDCLVYPDEPSFPRLFSRSHEYKTAGHLLNDFLCGTPNPIHFAAEADVSVRSMKDRKQPAIGALQSFKEIIPKNSIEHKKIPGIQNCEFPHRDFFLKYIEGIERRSLSMYEPDPKMLVEHCFDALADTLRSVQPDFEFGSIRMFKQPISSFDDSNLEWFQKAWPDGKIIFLHRNPYGRLASIIQYEKQREQGSRCLRRDRKAFLNRCIDVARDHRKIEDLIDQNGIMLLQYEMLVSEPEKEMRKVCGFLEIEYHSSLLKPSKLGQRTNISTNRTGQSDKISVVSTERWRKSLSLSEKFALFLCLRQQFYLVRKWRDFLAS